MFYTAQKGNHQCMNLCFQVVFLFLFFYMTLHESFSSYFCLTEEYHENERKEVKKKKKTL